MEAQAASWLPLDLLLEVLARSDPVTISRGAATCKLLRRHVTAAEFLGRLLRCRAGPDSGDRFLAAGLFYRRPVKTTPMSIPVAPGPSRPAPPTCCWPPTRCRSARRLSPPSAGGGCGWWGPATIAPDLPVLLRRNAERVQPFPVVLGGGAYWLYREHAATPTRDYHMVALDAATGQARSIAVPGVCIRKPLALGACRDLILASVGGELSLVVAEFTAIVVWMVREDGAGAGWWERSVLVGTDTILRSVEALLPPIACQSVEFEWFGQRSGNLVFQMHGVGLVVLNLRTKRVYQLETSARKMSFDLLWPYELDLLSLIALLPADRL
ncbi:unnamed protein product [Urochloa decumbens]|uniref:DUF7595 domain-containing protein n=1 Tax=Urochloa decumbens TaxID=240449 RepID=A0ABC8ZZP0_9POAL